MSKRKADRQITRDDIDNEDDDEQTVDVMNNE